MKQTIKLFYPSVPFRSALKRQKTNGFLRFLKGIEMELG